MGVVNIQGIDCSFRDLKEGENILYSEYSQSEQYFRREEIPFSEGEINDLFSVDYEARKEKYTRDQKLWVDREEKRMTYGEGVYASINGNLTYIPASYWGYINYWVGS